MYKYIIINIINNKLKCSNQTELSYTFREGRYYLKKYSSFISVAIIPYF